MLKLNTDSILWDTRQVFGLFCFFQEHVPNVSKPTQYVMKTATALYGYRGTAAISELCSAASVRFPICLHFGSDSAETRQKWRERSWWIAPWVMHDLASRFLSLLAKMERKRQHKKFNELSVLLRSQVFFAGDWVYIFSKNTWCASLSGQLFISFNRFHAEREINYS